MDYEWDGFKKKLRICMTNPSHQLYGIILVYISASRKRTWGASRRFTRPTPRSNVTAPTPNRRRESSKPSHKIYSFSLFYESLRCKFSWLIAFCSLEKVWQWTLTLALALTRPNDQSGFFLGFDNRQKWIQIICQWIPTILTQCAMCRLGVFFYIPIGRK